MEETRRDLGVYKRAFSIAERDKRDLEERFEREKQALSDENRQLRERGMHVHEERFERARQALNDGILQLKVRLFPLHPVRSRRGFTSPLARLAFAGCGDADGRVLPLSNQAIVTREKRVYQRNPLPVTSNNRQHTMVLEGTKAA